MPTGWEYSCLKSTQGKKRKLGAKLISETLVCRTKDCFFPLLQEKFITNLLRGTQRLTPEFAVTNSHVISHIINCSTAILLLSDTKCDLDVNPNPKVSLLVQQLTLKYLSSCYNNEVDWFPPPVFVWGRLWDLSHSHVAVGVTIHRVFYHQARDGHHISEQVRSTQALSYYFSFNWKSVVSDSVWICSMLYSYTPSDLSNAVLGSQQNGEYIKLPSYSAMTSQIRGHHRITTQVCVLHHFTWPVPTFNGAFLPLRWQHSQQIPTHLMTASQGRSAAWCSARESRK